MLKRLFRKKSEVVGAESEKKEDKRTKRDIRIEHLFAAYFTLNAIVVSVLGSIILRVSVIAAKYYDRIVAIDRGYAAYVDAGTYLAGALFIYAVINVLGAAYFLYEAKMGV